MDTPRFVQTLRGFAGYGAPWWIASVLADRTPPAPEDLSPEDVAGADCGYAEVGGLPVLYRELGARGVPVVFIHGFGERLQVWEPIQQAVAQTRHTVALDLWGFGASVRPDDITPRDWVREVLGLLDALEIERAVLVGHSLGARVSLMCARHAPERLSGLVLCNADWGQAPRGYLLAQAMCRGPWLAMLLGKMRANPEHLRRLLTVFGTPSLHPDLEGLQRPLRVKGTARAWRALGSAPPWRDVRGLTRWVRCPAVVVHGHDDPIVPRWAGEELAHRLHAPLRLIPNCGHFAHEEYPELVCGALQEFLRELDGAPATEEVAVAAL
jgi:pimeloyl-ACP methyl ester carboxylesterase